MVSDAWPSAVTATEFLTSPRALLDRAYMGNPSPSCTRHMSTSRSSHAGSVAGNGVPASYCLRVSHTVPNGTTRRGRGVGHRTYPSGLFVVLEVGTRRIVHWNVTEHPTADWTIQQFRTVMTAETSRFVLHDREGIYRQTLTGRSHRCHGWCSRHTCEFRKRTPSVSDRLGRCVGSVWTS